MHPEKNGFEKGSEGGTCIASIYLLGVGTWEGKGNSLSGENMVYCFKSAEKRQKRKKLRQVNEVCPDFKKGEQAAIRSQVSSREKTDGYLRPTQSGRSDAPDGGERKKIGKISREKIERIISKERAGTPRRGRQGNVRCIVGREEKPSPDSRLREYAALSDINRQRGGGEKKGRGIENEERKRL